MVSIIHDDTTNQFMNWRFLLATLYSRGKQYRLRSTAGLPMSYKLGPRWDDVITWSNFKSETIF